MATASVSFSPVIQAAPVTDPKGVKFVPVLQAAPYSNVKSAKFVAALNANGNNVATVPGSTDPVVPVVPPVVSGSTAIVVVTGTLSTNNSTPATSGVTTINPGAGYWLNNGDLFWGYMHGGIAKAPAVYVGATLSGIPGGTEALDPSKPTATFTGGGGSGAQGRVHLEVNGAVWDGAHWVTGVHSVFIENPGSGYTSAPTITISPPPGGSSGPVVPVVPPRTTPITAALVASGGILLSGTSAATAAGGSVIIDPGGGVTGGGAPNEIRTSLKLITASLDAEDAPLPPGPPPDAVYAVIAAGLPPIDASLDAVNTARTEAIIAAHLPIVDAIIEAANRGTVTGYILAKLIPIEGVCEAKNRSPVYYDIAAELFLIDTIIDTQYIEVPPIEGAAVIVAKLPSIAVALTASDALPTPVNATVAAELTLIAATLYDADALAAMVELIAELPLIDSFLYASDGTIPDQIDGDITADLTLVDCFLDGGMVPTLADIDAELTRITSGLSATVYAVGTILASIDVELPVIRPALAGGVPIMCLIKAKLPRIKSTATARSVRGSWIAAELSRMDSKITGGEQSIAAELPKTVIADISVSAGNSGALVGKLKRINAYITGNYIVRTRMHPMRSTASSKRGVGGKINTRLPKLNDMMLSKSVRGYQATLIVTPTPNFELAALIHRIEAEVTS